MTHWDALIIAGGAGTRLGGASKPDITVGGTRLLERTLAAVAQAKQVVIVGGPPCDGARWTREDPPGSGPAMAVAAGMAAISASATWTMVLAVDTPRVAQAVPLLHEAAARDGAWMVDAHAHPQPLLALYRSSVLRARCAQVAPGQSMRRLVAGLDLVAVADPHDFTRDLDTWDDAQYWKEQLG